MFTVFACTHFHFRSWPYGWSPEQICPTNTCNLSSVTLAFHIELENGSHHALTSCGAGVSPIVVDTACWRWRFRPAWQLRLCLLSLDVAKCLSFVLLFTLHFILCLVLPFEDALGMLPQVSAYSLSSPSPSPSTSPSFPYKNMDVISH